LIKHIHLTKQNKQIIAPPSKSFAQRVLFATALSKQSAILNNIGKSDDVLNVLKIVDQLGFTVKSSGEKTLIQKDTEPLNNLINIGESGLGTRLSVPILTRFFDDFMVHGTGTILNRTMDWFEKYLPQTGLYVALNNGHLPLKATGTITAGNYTVDGSKSSQYISGLLMTLPLCQGDSILEVTNPTSIPYIDITLEVMAKYNVQVTHENHQQFKISGNQSYYLDELDYTVEGDFSSAAFWIVYGLLANGIEILNLNPNSVQADKAILNVVEAVGGSYSWNQNRLTIHQPNTLIPFQFDATHCPDLFPILTVLAAGIKGESSITGTNRLKNKESDRKSVLLKEFSNLALEIKATDNKIIINGTGTLQSSEINSHSDHRIAMSAAIASLLTPSGISITNAECVHKSYPSFWKTADNI